MRALEILAPVTALIIISLPLMAASEAKPNIVTIDQHHRVLLNGQPFFPITMSPGPPVNAKAPDGRDALEELKDGGVNMLRLGLFDGTQWNKETEELLAKNLDWANAHGIYGMPNLGKLSLIADPKDNNAKHLKAFLDRFASHPALFAWKTYDEPQWAKAPIQEIANAYKLVKEWDPNHPCWMNQAPRGTLPEIAEYNKYCDITGLDIYPVSVPMGKHSHLPNKNLSVVGDYAKWLSESVEGKKPFWMVLQISFSGAVPPKPVIFPTLEQERYMVYQSIINGARGFLFFGGANILQGRDKELGWNWTFWKDVLKPVLLEITSPEMKEVLNAPESKTGIKASGVDNVEFTVREVGKNMYILAAKREGPSALVRFDGLPAKAGRIDVLFEDRSVEITDGAISDTFKANQVHIYKLAVD